MDPQECATLKQVQATTPATVKRWNFENLDFLSTRPLIPPGATDGAGTCPANTIPVYRAYNDGFARGVDSNHRLTRDHAAYMETVGRGWVSEGVRMCAPE